MNISEIAKMAGVSAAAVSRYLNDGYVSQEKKERIAAVIEKTGYRPSSQAQMLRTKRTHVIGVVIPKINSESISRVVAGISQVLSEAGYQLLLGNTENDEKKELDFIRVFQNNHVDGIILLGTMFTKEHYKVLSEVDVPVIVVGQKAEKYPSVYHNDRGAARDVTKCLTKKCTDIVYLGVTELDHAVGYERKCGFQETMDERQGSQVVARKQVEFSVQSGYEKMKEVLDEKVSFDGVFCSTDNIAAGACKAMRENGLQIGEKIGVVGFGHSRVTELMMPTLTTVHFHYMTSGIEAAKMLLEYIQEPKHAIRSMELEYEIVEQESTK